MSLDDDMLYHLLEVQTPKEGWDMFASMFAKKPKTIEDKVCCQCGKPGHIAWDCKVTMVVIKGNSATADSRKGESNKHKSASDEDC